MSAFTRLVILAILAVFLKTVICENIIINIRGDSTSTNYYKQIKAEQDITEKLLENLFYGSSSSFSLRYTLNDSSNVATGITILKTDKDSTFFKCWHQPSTESVTCERQTVNQCMFILTNESCCSYRNAFLWNTSLEFLYSTEIRNFTVNCGNQTNQQILIIYELLQTSSSSTSTLITSTLKDSCNCSNLIIGLSIGLCAAVALAISLFVIGFIILKKRKNRKNQPCNKSNDCNLNNGARDQDYANKQEPVSNNNITAVNHLSDISKDVSEARNNSQHNEKDVYLDVIDTNIPYNVTSYESVQPLSSGYVNKDLEEGTIKDARTSRRTENNGVKHKNTENGIEETQAPLQLKSMNDAIIMDKTYQEVNEYDSLTRDSEPPEIYSRIVSEH